MKDVAPALRDKLAALSRACTNTELVLRANGEEISKASRDEMLARCVAGQYVELEVDILAFEQKTGMRNRNFVRFRDGAMLAIGRTGVNTPFLRDHRQSDSLARGGTIVASQTEKRGEGDYAIRQTAKLTAPWAVELALRGLMSTVSIGWNPTGDVVCSVCQANFWRCSHYPGETYKLDSGVEVVCERVYTAAELIETSAVPVPAVPAAQIDEIRAALAATPVLFPGFRATEAQKENHMHLLQALVALLSLPATAGEGDAIKAVEKLKSELAADAAELTIVKTELATAKIELNTYRTQKRKTDEDKFISEALSHGQIGTGDEAGWRALYEVNSERAIAEMAKRPHGSATPVGQPRQSAKTPADPPASTGLQAASAIVESGGGSLAGVRKNLKQAGYNDKQIDDMLARHIGGASKEG
jgi:hypothetical protein